MRLFNYLFYKIYKLINFLGNTEFYPEGSAWFISSIFVWLNMLTILNFAELRFERDLVNMAFVIALYILYLAATFMYFFRKDRYENIVTHYDKESSAKKAWGSVFVAAYVLITIVLHLFFSEQRRAMALGI